MFQVKEKLDPAGVVEPLSTAYNRLSFCPHTPQSQVRSPECECNGEGHLGEACPPLLTFSGPDVSVDQQSASENPVYISVGMTLGHDCILHKQERHMRWSTNEEEEALEKHSYRKL